MRAITRGWVVQVTPVHERSSPRASRLCFEFYTVTRGGGRGGIADKQLGPSHAWPWGNFTACQAPRESRYQVGSSCLWMIAGQARCFAQVGWQDNFCRGRRAMAPVA